MTQIYSSVFGEVLRQYRQASGLTQEELAERAHLSVGTISALERGINHIPQRGTLGMLVNALALSPADADAFRAQARHRPRRTPTGLSGPTIALKQRWQGDVAEGMRTSNLPRPLTSFIGRRAEVDALTNLVRRSPLITLTGPPGTGKTRLAFEVAAGICKDFADGVVFVQLAPITDPDLVVAAIAQELGIPEMANCSLFRSLQEHLRRKHLLLVLDNFEQVLPAAVIVADMLRAAPRMTVMVTSRALLHLRAEHNFPVPPLALPDRSARPSLEDLRQNEAISLFVERAQSVKPDFVLTQANASTMVEICRRLDGLPLAIELAAARVQLLPPQALLARLERRCSVLTGGPQDLPSRQRAIRSAIDWSFDLLAADAQALFGRLAVFVGGCTMEAAGAVCKLGNHLDKDVLPTMAALVDQSLLRQTEQADGEPRFMLLESLREYAWEQLTARGEAESVQHQHAAYYLALAEEGSTESPPWDQTEQQYRLEQLASEQDNLYTALRWFIDREDTVHGLRLAAALGRYWFSHHHWTEGRRWLGSVLSLPVAAAPARARAVVLYWAGALAIEQGDYLAARSLLGESVAVWRQLGNKDWLAPALSSLARVALQTRDVVARPLLEESLALSRQLGDLRGVAWRLHQMGTLATYLGDHMTSRSFLLESLELWTRMGDRRGAAATTYQLGYLAMVQGDYLEARARFGKCIASYRELRAMRDVAAALDRLGELADREGDYQQANTLCTRSLELSRQLGDWDGIAWSLKDLGRVARHKGESQRAITLFKESLALRSKQGHTWAIVGCLSELAESVWLAGRPEQATRLFAVTYALSATGSFLLSVGDLSGYDRMDADRYLAALRVTLGNARFATAWSEGQRMTREQAVALALTEGDLGVECAI